MCNEKESHRWGGGLGQIGDLRGCLAEKFCHLTAVGGGIGVVGGGFRFLGEMAALPDGTAAAVVPGASASPIARTVRCPLDLAVNPDAVDG